MNKEVCFGPILEDGGCEIFGVEDGKCYGTFYPFCVSFHDVDIFDLVDYEV